MRPVRLADIFSESSQAERSGAEIRQRTTSHQPGNNVYDLYPQSYTTKPDLPSPFTDEDGNEYIIIIITKEQRFGVVCVTVENKEAVRAKFYRGNQLAVDEADFPTLAATDLHSDTELAAVQTITGKPIGQITEDGRPGRFSAAGFLAEDEDIISTLKGDNRIVKALDLTHPQMARPMFHVWNLILLELDSGRLGRFWDRINGFYYNGVQVSITVRGSKGFQQSIFNDDVRGSFNMDLFREPSADELNFLKLKYSRLSPEEFERMASALSHFFTGEMVPYYIQCYGFYEGHTAYRADPIAIAFIFGLRSLEEIEAAFDGKLFEALTAHFK